MKRSEGSPILLLAIVVAVTLSPVVGVVGVGAAAGGAPAGMVGVPSDQISDLRADSVPRNISDGDLEGAVLASKHAATTEVGIVTESQAEQVAEGGSPADVAGDRVCSRSDAGDAPGDCSLQTSLVISDDVHSEGRTIAIEVGAIEDAIGYTPRWIEVENNESGESWSVPTRVEDGWLLIDVPHFSSNSVTWSGSVEITGSPSTDGAQHQYDLSSTDSVSDPVANLTGHTATEWDNESAAGVSPSGSSSISVAGNADPTGPGGTPTLKVTGATFKTYNAVMDSGDGSTDTTTGIVGDNGADTKWKTEVKMAPTFSGNVSSLTIDVGGISGSSYDLTADVYIVQESEPDGTYGEGTLVKDNWSPKWETGEQQFSISEYEVDSSKNYSVEFVTQNTDGDGTRDMINLEDDDSKSGVWFSVTGSTYSDVGDVTMHTGNQTKNLNATVDGTTLSFGDFNSSETKTKSVSITTSASSIDWTGSGGALNYTLEIKERTETVDPAVEINGDNWLNHSGTIADGNTVSLTGNSSWIVSGTNYVNVSVGDGTLSADAPTPSVALVYSHDASDKQSVTFAGEKWSERYNVSKTFASDRSSANLTIPFDSSAVVSVRDVEKRINGSSWSSVSASSNSFDGTTLTVDLGSVSTNETVEIRANGSKVSVINGSITVLDPTTSADELDTKIRIDNHGTDFAIAVGGSASGHLLHHTVSESWSADEFAILTSEGTQKLHLPNAGAGSEARVRTIPLEVNPSNEIRSSVVDANEPRFTIKQGSTAGSDDVELLWHGGTEGETLRLWSVTDDAEIMSDTVEDGTATFLTSGNTVYLIEEKPSSGSGPAVAGVSGGDSSDPLSILALFGGMALAVLGSAYVGRRWFGVRGTGATSITLMIGGIVGLVGIEAVTARSVIGGLFDSLFGAAGAGLGGFFASGAGTVAIGGALLLALWVVRSRYGAPLWFLVVTGGTIVVWVLDSISDGALTAALDTIGPLAWLIVLGGGALLLWRALKPTTIQITGRQK